MADRAEQYYIATQWQLMWRKFRRHRLALLGGGILLVFYLFALLAQFVSPSTPSTRNRDLATPSVSASSSSSAALAFPSWGGAVTLTRSVPYRIPSTRSRDARGCTRTLIVQPSVASKDTPLSAKAAKSSIV